MQMREREMKRNWIAAGELGLQKTSNRAAWRARRCMKLEFLLHNIDCISCNFSPRRVWKGKSNGNEKLRSWFFCLWVGIFLSRWRTFCLKNWKLWFGIYLDCQKLNSFLWDWSDCSDCRNLIKLNLHFNLLRLSWVGKLKGEVGWRLESKLCGGGKREEWGEGKKKLGGYGGSWVGKGIEEGFDKKVNTFLNTRFCDAGTWTTFIRSTSNLIQHSFI